MLMVMLIGRLMIVLLVVVGLVGCRVTILSGWGNRLLL